MQSNAQRKKLWWAVVASLFVHLLVAFLLVGFNTAFAPPVALEDDKPVELTMVDLAATTPPAPSATPPYIETDPAKETAEQPKEKTFQSNVNSLAASRLAASGEALLPSQEGKERPALDFETHEYSLGREEVRGEPSPSPPPPPPSTATPGPSAKPRPQPSAMPLTTPLPEPSPTPSSEQLAMLTGTPPPPIRDLQETEATPPETGPTVPPMQPRPLPARPGSAYRAEKQETKITGRITNRGNSAVNAVGTPVGRYRKQIEDEIGSRWYYRYASERDSFKIGTARIAAELDAQGRMQNLRIISNSSDEAFVNICLQSFQEAQVPPIPPDLAATLPGGILPIEISFILMPPDGSVRALNY